MKIGIDLGGTKIEGVLLDDAGSERHRLRFATPRHDYAATVATAAALVSGLEYDSEAPATVGVGIPGAISPATGLVKNANATWLNGRPLDKDLAAALDRPVRVANDANCFAIAEAIDGAGAGAPVVFGVILGTGVGGGLVVERRVLAGANAIAGEWGHNPLPWTKDDERPRDPCYCGKTGCIETYLSGSGLSAAFQAAGGGCLAASGVAALADDGDAVALGVLELYADRLARALASVINVVDPDVVVLGGGLSNIGRLYPEVRRLWPRYVFSDRVDTRLRRNRHGDSAGVRGAAWLWDH